jgi:hypothetical protein
VIDILQEFDFSKRMENKLKSLRRKEVLISAVNASLYAKRFFEYVTRRCLGVMEIESDDGRRISGADCRRLAHLLSAMIRPLEEERTRAWRRCCTHHDLLLESDFKETMTRREEVSS